MMEEHLNDIRCLLIGVIALLIIIATCQCVLVAEKIKPSRAKAESKLPCQRVDLIKIGGRSVFLNDILKR